MRQQIPNICVLKIYSMTFVNAGKNSKIKFLIDRKLKHIYQINNAICHFFCALLVIINLANIQSLKNCSAPEECKISPLFLSTYILDPLLNIINLAHTNFSLPSD